MREGSEFIESKPSKVLIVTHFDTDGLASASILTTALKDKGLKTRLIVKQNLDDDFIKELSESEEEHIILTDIGATKEDELADLNKKIIILDHHKPSRSDKNILSRSDKNISLKHLNPFLEGLEEQNTISGSGVTYFFTLGMSTENKKLAYLAVLGALGDTQEKNGFKELNDMILQHAVLQKTIVVEKQLKLFGLNSRPLNKVLEYSTDLMIPGVTNNPEGVERLLKELNIKTYHNNYSRKYFNLWPDEKERLTKKILELKKDLPEKEIMVSHYTLVNERKRSFKDLKEYATIINACGRLGDYETALKAMAGDYGAQDKAINNLRYYKRLIRDALQEVDSLRTQNDSRYFHDKQLVIIDLENKIMYSIAGIIASILARNKIYERGTVICTLADETPDTIKISLRIGGDSPDKNLQDILQKILEPMGLSSGGHKNAAGTIIPKNKKDLFIDRLKEFVS